MRYWIVFFTLCSLLAFAVFTMPARGQQPPADPTPGTAKLKVEFIDGATGKPVVVRDAKTGKPIGPIESRPAPFGPPVVRTNEEVVPCGGIPGGKCCPCCPDCKPDCGCGCDCCGTDVTCWWPGKALTGGYRRQAMRRQQAIKSKRQATEEVFEHNFGDDQRSVLPMPREVKPDREAAWSIRIGGAAVPYYYPYPYSNYYVYAPYTYPYYAPVAPAYPYYVPPAYPYYGGWAGGIWIGGHR